MRWPMLASGIAALILLPVYVWRTLYAICAVLATWMHLIAGPLAVAPFLYHFVLLRREEAVRRGARLRA